MDFLSEIDQLIEEKDIEFKNKIEREFVTPKKRKREGIDEEPNKKRKFVESKLQLIQKSELEDRDEEIRIFKKKIEDMEREKEDKVFSERKTKYQKDYEESLSRSRFSPIRFNTRNTKEEELTKVKIERDELKLKISEVINENVNTQSKNEHLQFKLQEQKNENFVQNLELKNKSNEIVYLKKDLESYKKSFVDKTNFGRPERPNRKMSLGQGGRSVEYLEFELEKSLEKISTLESRESEINSMKEDYKLVCREMEKILEKSGRMSKENSELREDNSKLQKRMENINILKQENNQLMREIESLKMIQNDNTSNIVNYDKVKDELENWISRLGGENNPEKVSNFMIKLQNDNKTLIAKLRQVEVELENKKREIEVKNGIVRKSEKKIEDGELNGKKMRGEFDRIRMEHVESLEKEVKGRKDVEKRAKKMAMKIKDLNENQKKLEKEIVILEEKLNTPFQVLKYSHHPYPGKRNVQMKKNEQEKIEKKKNLIEEYTKFFKMFKEDKEKYRDKCMKMKRKNQLLLKMFLSYKKFVSMIYGFDVDVTAGDKFVFKIAVDKKEVLEVKEMEDGKMQILNSTLLEKIKKYKAWEEYAKSEWKLPILMANLYLETKKN